MNNGPRAYNNLLGRQRTAILRVWSRMDCGDKNRIKAVGENTDPASCTARFSISRGVHLVKRSKCCFEIRPTCSRVQSHVWFAWTTLRVFYHDCSVMNEFQTNLHNFWKCTTQHIVVATLAACCSYPVPYSAGVHYTFFYSLFLSFTIFGAGLFQWP